MVTPGDVSTVLEYTGIGGPVPIALVGTDVRGEDAGLAGVVRSKKSATRIPCGESQSSASQCTREKNQPQCECLDAEVLFHVFDTSLLATFNRIGAEIVSFRRITDRASLIMSDFGLNGHTMHYSGGAYDRIRRCNLGRM